MCRQIMTAFMIALVISVQAAAQQAETPATTAAPAAQQTSIPQAAGPATDVQANAQTVSSSPQTHTIKVPRRTGLKFELLEPLSSATAKAGDDVPLRLAKPLVINNATVLPAGEVVHGKVVKARKAGPKCRNGAVEWKLESITFPDGSKVSTKVWGVGQQEVPERLFTEDDSGGDPLIYLPAINEWWDVILAVPIYALDLVNLAIVAPLFVIGAPFMIGQDSCKTPGKEYELATDTPVAVMVTKSHRVNY